MGRKVSDGRSVKVAVPENTTINQGTFVYLGGFLGMAVREVVTGAGETAEVVLNIELGEYETSQTKDEDDMLAGADIFWDEDAKVLTETPTLVFAGKVTVDKDVNGVIWFKLAPQLAVVTERVADKQDDAPAAAGGGLPATLLTGEAGSNNAILWVANDAGPGGHVISVDIEDGAPEGALTVTVNDNAITVTLADGGNTAAEVIGAVNGDDNASALVTVLNGDDSNGTGGVVALTIYQDRDVILTTEITL